jgi:hypothetical protein
MEMCLNGVGRHTRDNRNLLQVHVFQKTKNKHPALIGREIAERLLHLVCPLSYEKLVLWRSLSARFNRSDVSYVDRRRFSLPPELKLFHSELVANQVVGDTE